jgi:glycine cleavage system regulatory protein
LDQTNKEAVGPPPGSGTVSALGGRGAAGRDEVELAAPVGVAETSERAPLRVVNEAPAVQDVAWQAKLDRAEETAGQLYKLAEAAQAAIDVLRAKLASAEAEINRIGRGRTAVAEELHRQANEYQALDSVRKELERKCDALAAEAFNIARDRDRLVAERMAGLSSLIDPAFDPLFWQPARLGACSAWWGHVPFAHWLIRAAVPEVLVELGTLTGVSYSAFCHAVLEAGLPTRCHAVGTWCGDRQADETNDEVYEDFRRFHDRHYDKFSTLLQRTFDTALGFSDGSIDLLHIAGPQIHLSARHDFESWLPKLSKRGIVLLHATNLRDDDCGVWRLWEELRGRYPSFEFLHGCGLGVLAVGEAAPAVVLALCRLTDPAAIATLRSRFALIGERWSQIERLEAFKSEVARAEAQSQGLRSQVEALDSAMQARTASFQIEIERVEAMSADRAMAAEMAETAVALKAGELSRSRAEIAAMQARTASLQMELERVEAMSAIAQWRRKWRKMPPH